MNGPKPSELRRAGARVRAWLARRDQLVLDAYRAGRPKKEIARIVGLSAPAIDRIIERTHR